MFTTLGIGGVTLFHFFPDWFYRTLGLEHGLAVRHGLPLHLHVVLRHQWRLLRPLHLRFRRVAPPAAQPAHASARPGTWCCTISTCARNRCRAKFNGAQRLAYTGVILMGAGSLVTGLAIYKPTQLAWLTNLLGGYAWARGSISP